MVLRKYQKDSKVCIIVFKHSLCNLLYKMFIVKFVQLQPVISLITWLYWLESSIPGALGWRRHGLHYFTVRNVICVYISAECQIRAEAKLVLVGTLFFFFFFNLCLTLQINVNDMKQCGGPFLKKTTHFLSNYTFLIRRTLLLIIVKMGRNLMWNSLKTSRD